MIPYLLGFLFFFALGTAVGSFVNVVVMRSLIGENFLWDRSRCDRCRRELQWYEMIPLISFLLLRGRCRTCHKEIDVMHPVVELLTGTLFVWWYFLGAAFFQISAQPLSYVQPLFWLCIGLLMLFIVATDLRSLLIPDSAVLAIGMLTILYRIALMLYGVYQPRDFALALFGAAATMALFLFLWLITRGRGMGFGDVKLMFVLGLVVEWPNVWLSVFLSFIFGAVVGLVLMVLKRARLKSAVPFAPFMISAVAVTLLWGDALVRWYLALL